MQTSQVWAVTLRHFRQLFGDSNLLLQALFWPILDVFVWGFLGMWIQHLHDVSFDVQLAVLLAIFLWRATNSGAQLIGVALYEELTANNLINVFASPLRLKNWIAGVLIFSAVMVLCVNVLYVTPLIWAMHGGSLSVGLKIFKCLLMFALPMFICGVALGALALSALITFGKRANELIYIITWSLAPFTMAYYPIEVLPAWGQAVSRCLPFIYVLEAMRDYVLFQANPLPGLIIGTLMATTYAVAGVWLFLRMFKRSKVNGLARLSD